MAEISARKSEFGLAVALLLAGSLPGLLTHDWQLALLLPVAAYLSWHLYQLIRLLRLLHRRKRLRPPYPPGLWNEICLRIASLQTRARKRKRSLTRFASRFKEAAAALPDAAIIIDKYRNIEWANPAAATLLAIDWPQMQTRPLHRLVSDPTLKEYFDRADYARPLEFSPPHNKGIVLSLHVTAFGKKRQRLLIARDITQIYHLNQTRRDFVSNVSHELRTPLTVIMGFLETLIHEGEQPPAQARAMQLMQQQTHRMENLISDLLTLSRLEMETEGSSYTPVPVPELLATIVEEARSLSADARHEFTLEADPALWLWGDEPELHSAFSNLIFNAVRHTPQRSRIDIRWAVDGENLSMSVSDSGEGIAARHIPRLTERFYRVEAGRSRQSGGTGLGLAIVKHVLNHHQARLKIESQIGKGSRFSCLFPRKLARRPQREQG